MNGNDDAAVSRRSAPAGMALAGLDGRLLWASDDFTTLLGAGWELRTAALSAGAEARVAAVVAGQAPSTTFTLRGAREVEVTVAMVATAGAAPTQLALTAADVAATRRAERRAEVATDELREILDSISDGVFSIETAGWTYTYVNPAAARTVNRTVAQLTGQHVWEALPGARESTFAALYEQAARDQVVVSFLDYYQPLDRWFGGTVYPREGGITVYFRDVSARQKAEEAQRESERTLATIFDSTFELMLLLAHEPDGSWPILAVNQAYLTVAQTYGFALTRADLVGRSFPEVLATLLRIPPEKIEETLAPYREAIRTGAPVTFDASMPTSGGLAHTENVVLPVADREGRFTRVLWTGRDVTARKRAEEALSRQSAELERRVADRTAELRVTNLALSDASRAKDEFLASMSHELRTPLNAVLGLSEALGEGVYGAVGDAQRRALSRIEESGRHLLELINDILDLTKIEAGRTPLELATVSIDEVCRASLRLVQGAAQKKRQRVTLALAEGFGVIRADERRLKQILVNLLSNAVKFTPDGGTVGLEVAADPGGGTMRFTVWDTGIGIAPRDQTRLFLPFVQLDSSLARHHAGTGLGLALVRKLVELHGGTVGIESEPGKGSRFSLVLPLQPATADHPPALTPAFGIPRVSRTSTVAPRPPGGPSARILLAEDDETNIVTVADFLGSRGHDVRVARNGAEALRLAEEAVPDLVIMDVQMPVLDGLTAMARLRAAASPALRAVPIIALTALAMSGDRERCLEAGADEYLTKPVGLKQLAAAVAEHLSRGRVRRAAAGEG